MDKAQLEEDITKIEAYLDENGIQAKVHSSGIRYVVVDGGDGRKPDICNSVKVTYKGWFLSNDSLFDQSQQEISLGLSRVITGWQIGVPLIKKGGKIVLYIPSVYAYGEAGSGTAIPPNSNLIFEIELKDIFR
ncbi:MAG: FKBP-type peptidyl-prolyl cis-trans isomerase [Gracilimonas sp.]|nr:FKBP-type peptidyl-prolyl cis-trans isomerase [Gracilimonas sp.]